MPAGIATQAGRPAPWNQCPRTRYSSTVMYRPTARCENTGPFRFFFKKVRSPHPCPWIYLLLAGLFEIGFALGMKYSEGFSKPLPTAATVVSALISLYLMSQAMKSIPVGTAYAIWTGIGAMGVAVLGIYLFNDSASPARLACVGLIVAGVIGLKLVSPN